MHENPEYEALIERLRAELMKADEDLRQATTPEVKEQAIARYGEGAGPVQRSRDA